MDHGHDDTQHPGAHPDGRGGPRAERGGEQRGPEGTEFLDLEVSRLLYGEASRLTREAAREILKEAIKARLRERLGDRLEAIGRLAADELADDVEANLAIEARIGERSEQRRALGERLREALSAPKR